MDKPKRLSIGSVITWLPTISNENNAKMIGVKG